MSDMLSRFVVALCAILIPFTRAQADYSPRDFFTSAPAELFYTDDEMSGEDKAAIVKRRFKQVQQFNCSAWGVASESKDALTLKYCADSEVNVRVYPLKDAPNQPLVAVQSVRASGRAVDLSWFKVSGGPDSFTPLTAEQLKKFGLEQPQAIDFMARGNPLPEGGPPTIQTELDEEGRVHSFIYTWMERQWEHKEPDFSFHFIWDGARFTRQAIKN